MSARVLGRATSAAAQSFVHRVVATGGSLLNTDEAWVYRELNDEYNHGMVDPWAVHVRRGCAAHEHD
jgi:hypothetical protein